MIPGIYQMDAAAYHADPCPAPSLSNSVAKVLIRQSPLHAWTLHPKFGGGKIDPSRVMDIGSAMHAMMLGCRDKVVPIGTVYGPKTKRKDLIGLPVTSYASDAAQEDRDMIRDAGDIPVLFHEWEALQRAELTAMQQISVADDGPGFTASGTSEAVILANDNGLWLRCMVDRLPHDRKLPPYDLKATKLSAAPGGWERRLQTEYAFQDAFYRRVIRLALGYEPGPMRFIVVEIDPPHGVAIMAASPMLAEIAEREVERAIRMWRECLTADRWPCYPPHTAWVDPTGWQVTQSEEAAARDQIARAAANDPRYRAFRST